MKDFISWEMNHEYGTESFLSISQKTKKYLIAKSFQ